MPKRDFDRIREILLHVEQQESNDGWVWIRKDGFFEETDAYQLELLEQVGFAETDAYTISTSLPGRIRISFFGHDYLDAIRSEGIWQQTKETVAETGGSATLEVVKAVAVGFAKRKIREHTGIDL